MTLTEQAVAWAVSLYDARPGLHNFPREIGAVLWNDEQQKLLADPIVESPDHNAVLLYDYQARLRVLRAKPGAFPEYIGDFHTHPRTGTWAGQLPSPDDLFDMGVAADHWKVDLASLEIESVRRAPRLQLLLLGAFELIFVMERVADRSEFADHAAQEADLNERECRYRQWHRQLDVKLGALPIEATQAQARGLLESLLPEINEIMSGRAELRLVAAR